MNLCLPRLPKLDWLGKTTLNAMIRSDVPLTFAIRGAPLEGGTATRLAIKGRFCRDNFSNGPCGTRETQRVHRQLSLELKLLKCVEAAPLLESPSHLVGREHSSSGHWCRSHRPSAGTQGLSRARARRLGQPVAVRSDRTSV